MSIIFGHSISKIFRKTLSSNHASPFRKSFSFFKKDNKVKDISPYVIVRAVKEEYEEILKTMHEAYYPEEPTCSSLDITPNPVLDEHAMRAMTEGFTLVAKCKYTGCIVGACINESTHPWDPDLGEKLACTVRCENVKKLLMFYAYMMRAPDLFRCLNVNTVYEMAYLFIRKPHRKKGLAFRLARDSKSLGADAGFPVIRCDATSVHTAKICEHLGMQKIAEIPYCSYLDQKLEPVFQPPWPHESVKIYCDCAPQYNELKKRIGDKSGLFEKLKKKTKKKKDDQQNR